MLTLLLICNEPALAAHAHAAGVQRLFVDIERQGKAERQGGKDTFISTHQLADVAAVRAAVPTAELLLRVDPWGPETAAQIRQGVALGAQLIMLPMATHPAEVEAAAAVTRSLGVGLIPLVETPAAFARLGRIAAIDGVAEVYLGLNDLHLGLGLDFLFEPVAAGLIDHGAAILRASGKPWGFGGIATLGGGDVPGELVLAEHVRLGSTRVICSRAFTKGHKTLAAVQAAGVDIAGEISRLRAEEARLAGLAPAALTTLHAELSTRTWAAADRRRQHTRSAQAL